MGITSPKSLAKAKEWQAKYPERLRAHQLGLPGASGGKFTVVLVATN